MIKIVLKGEILTKNIDKLVLQARTKTKVAAKCRVWAMIYTKSNSASLDEQVNLLFGIISTAGLVTSDKLIKHIEVAQVKIKDKPRVEIMIELI